MPKIVSWKHSAFVRTFRAYQLSSGDTPASLHSSLRLHMLKLLKKMSCLIQSVKLQQLTLLPVLILTRCLPHTLSLNAGNFSTYFERLTPITSFNSKLPATYILYIKPLSSVCGSTSSGLLCPLQSATNLSTDAAVSHSLEQVSPEPGSPLFIYTYSWEDSSGIDCFVVLLAVSTPFIL